MIMVFIDGGKQYLGKVSKETADRLITQNKINKLKYTISTDFIII